MLSGATLQLLQEHMRHLMRTHMTSAKLATTVSKLIDGIEENERSVKCQTTACLTQFSFTGMPAS